MSLDIHVWKSASTFSVTFSENSSVRQVSISNPIICAEVKITQHHGSPLYALGENWSITSKEDGVS